ncbi:efflux transporter outer membrane subunit [Pseudomonas sp. FME51]|uniref:efflux transporter outer membrane subunit n=1 Tax=Pseudomonas sp. FME51 TaxID=2742609 RepID=UPI0018687690|nr:efflux transporter outer membrane subunit [Pseudomonas sp. FME51]
MRHLTVAALLVLTGCSAWQAEPEDHGIVMPVEPEQWQTPGMASSDVPYQWWQQFGSAELSQLIEQAHQQNFDIRTAVARIREAEAVMLQAGARSWPTVDAQLEAGQQGSFSDGDDSRRYTTGLALSYEVDLWGAIAATQQGALAALEQSRFDRDSIELSLSARVAAQWLHWVASREQLDIATRNLQRARSLLELINYQYQAGSANELDVVRQQHALASQERLVASQQQEYQQSEVALNVLLGRHQGAALHTRSLAALQLPDIALGIPADLLFRRPDIAQAEAALREASADIDVARAALLPSMQLAMTAGTGGDHVRQLLDKPIYSLLAGLTAPLFNHGSLAAGVDVARARREALLAGYQQSIINALTETRHTLFAITGIDAQLQAQERQLRLAQRAYELSEIRYRAGADPLTTLLLAQEDLFAAEENHTRLKLESLQARVDLFRVLGGGWQSRNGFETAQAPTESPSQI